MKCIRVHSKKLYVSKNVILLNISRTELLQLNKLIKYNQLAKELYSEGLHPGLKRKLQVCQSSNISKSALMFHACASDQLNLYVTYLYIISYRKQRGKFCILQFKRRFPIKKNIFYVVCQAYLYSWNTDLICVTFINRTKITMQQ